MTVASLWKALDRAGCGSPVGAEKLLDHQQLKNVRNPWNFNQRSASRPPTLAIDLSIWICESLSSSAMAENHSDPTMHLVFARTLKLLSLGVKLVGVIDGKRRLRGEGESDELRKRRSGTPFWRACRRCEELFNFLGVPIVRAKAEAEALCALLNQKGIVDGVITNDGDCFLFGAKVLYTKFSNENLHNGAIMRYDSDSLVACLDDDDSDQVAVKLNRDSPPTETVKLSRTDLIAFAILTGSDVVGSGLPKVGCRKALRFVRKCQLDNPLKAETAAFDEVSSWARTAKAQSGTALSVATGKKCSMCCHAGSKSDHLKNGCKVCGTEPGEPCFQLSQGGKFRKSLREKALALGTRFDPESIARVYCLPNDDQVPLLFLNMSANDIVMKSPDLQGLLDSSLVVRGRSRAESRSYVLQSLSRLMARSEFSALRQNTPALAGSRSLRLMHSNKNRPIPTEILKSITRSGVACYEISWKINATTTDREGNPIDEFEFSTTEEQTMVKKQFPEIVEKFTSMQKERMKQGNAEQEKRKAFLESLQVHPQLESSSGRQAGRGKVNSRARRGFIPVCKTTLSEHNKTVEGCLQGHHMMGDDVERLLEASAPKSFLLKSNDPTNEEDSIDTVSTLSTPGGFHQGFKVRNQSESPYKMFLSPGHLYFLGSQVTTVNPTTLPRSSFVMGVDDFTPEKKTTIDMSEIDVLEPVAFGGPSHGILNECHQRTLGPALLPMWTMEIRDCLSEKENTRFDPEIRKAATIGAGNNYFEIPNESRLPPPSPPCEFVSPQLKRSKCRAPGGTPPIAGNVPICNGRNTEFLERFSSHGTLQQSHDYHRYDFECFPPARRQDQAYDSSHIGGYTAADFTNFYEISSSNDMANRGYQERCTMAKGFTNVPSSNLDESLLVDSFAGVSIRTTCSPRKISSTKNVYENQPLPHHYEAFDTFQPDISFSSDMGCQWLNPSFFETPNNLIQAPSFDLFHNGDSSLRREEGGIVAAALAKLEHKTRLAQLYTEMNEDNTWKGYVGF